MAGLLQTSTFPLLAEDPAGPAAAQIAHDPSRPAPVCMPSQLDSPYIPVDSWIYPAVFRLYSLGFVDTIYLGMRPWTRASVENMLEVVGGRIQAPMTIRRPTKPPASTRRCNANFSMT